MIKRKIPIEVTGYKNVQVWVRDSVRNFDGLMWLSVKNDDYSDDDFLPWDGDSFPDDCPF